RRWPASCTGSSRPTSPTRSLRAPRPLAARWEDRPHGAGAGRRAAVPSLRAEPAGPDHLPLRPVDQDAPPRPAPAPGAAQRALTRDAAVHPPGPVAEALDPPAHLDRVLRGRPPGARLAQPDRSHEPPVHEGAARALPDGVRPRQAALRPVPPLLPAPVHRPAPRVQGQPARSPEARRARLEQPSPVR